MSAPENSALEAVEFWHRKCRDAEAESERLRAALDVTEDDVLALLDQHVSPEVHKEIRLRIIERAVARKASVSPEGDAP